MFRLTVYCLAFCLLCFLTGSATWGGEPDAAPTALKAGAAVESQLEKEQSRAWSLFAEAGDYVRGSFEAADMTLTLLNARGKRERSLSRGTGERLEFHFIVGDAGPYRLEVQATAAGKFSLHLQSIIPRSAQKPPAAELESPRLRKLSETLAAGGTTEEFWREIETRGTPLIESEGVTPPLAKGTLLVTFLWRGARESVRLFGAPTGDHDLLKRLGTSDVWHGSYRLPATARLAYKLAPDVPELNAPFWERRRAILATAQRDPFNPKCFPEHPVDQYEGESFIELPDAPPQPWLKPRSGAGSGHIEKHRLTSAILGNTRNVFLYRPDKHQPGAEGNGLLVLFDGEKYIEEVQAPLILDNLIAAGGIPPTAAILIGNPSRDSRSAELPCNPEFARFLSEELMPWARRQKVFAKPDRTVVAGASYGGLAAAYAGLKHPELFGNVYCQSGSFWWSPGATPGNSVPTPEWLPHQYALASRQPVKFYLEAGLFEETILTSTRHFHDVLLARGYEVRHQEHASGHGYFYWRYTFANGLIELLGPPESAESTER